MYLKAAVSFTCIFCFPGMIHDTLKYLNIKTVVDQHRRVRRNYSIVKSNLAQYSEVKEEFESKWPVINFKDVSRYSKSSFCCFSNSTLKLFGIKLKLTYHDVDHFFAILRIRCSIWRLFIARFK